MRVVPESVPASGVAGAVLTRVAWRKERVMYASVARMIDKQEEPQNSGDSVLEGGAAHYEFYMYCLLRCLLTRTAVDNSKISDIAYSSRRKTCSA